MKKLLRIDWDIIAGITAAVMAIVLHRLHVVDVEILFTIVLVLLALLLFRDLRRESHDERLGEAVDQIRSDVKNIELSLEAPAAVLIGFMWRPPGGPAKSASRREAARRRSAAAC